VVSYIGSKRLAKSAWAAGWRAVSKVLWGQSLPGSSRLRPGCKNPRLPPHSVHAFPGGQ